MVALTTLYSCTAVSCTLFPCAVTRPSIIQELTPCLWRAITRFQAGTYQALLELGLESFSEINSVDSCFAKPDLDGDLAMADWQAGGVVPLQR